MSDYITSATTYTATKRIYCKDCKYFDRFMKRCLYIKLEEYVSPITGALKSRVIDDVRSQLNLFFNNKSKALDYWCSAEEVFNKDNSCHLFEEIPPEPGFFKELLIALGIIKESE